MMAGGFPPPPMALTLNIALITADTGRVIFRGTPGENSLNPMRAVHGGWYGAILDSALGCAVHSTLAPGEGYTTLEYKVNITRAIGPGTEVEAIGTIQHRGRRTGTASAELRGVQDGKLYATGSTTCLILPATPAE